MDDIRSLAPAQSASTFSTNFLHHHRTNPVLLSAMSHRSLAAWLQVLTHSSSSFQSQAMLPLSVRLPP
jgi:hypothetical protein